MASTATLYLIPVPLAEVGHETCLPSYNASIVRSLKHFIVENIRSARRFLKAVDRDIDIDSLTFYELNKHTSEVDKVSYIAPLRAGHSVGVISEAGCPAVADPGSDIVALAHRYGVRVVPLIGPSSILLSLMASGFNGQGFAFRGYLPIEEAERTRVIREMEHRAIGVGETQIFIETPYRNDKMLDELLKHCRSNTRLCIACDITSDDAFIVTREIGAWRKHKPTIGKRPTIFLLGR